MIKKITIEKVSRFTKDREGKPFKTKDGKPYERVLLTVSGKTLSGFGGQWNQDWKAGDEVNVDITEVQKDGKTYYNFSQVSLTSELINSVNALAARVKNLEDKLLTSNNTPVPTFDVPEIDLTPQDEEALNSF